MVTKSFSIEFSDTEITRITVHLDSGIISGTVKMSVDGFKRNCSAIRQCINRSRYKDICFHLDDGKGGFISLPFYYLEENVFHVEPVQLDSK